MKALTLVETDVVMCHYDVVYMTIRHSKNNSQNISSSVGCVTYTGCALETEHIAQYHICFSQYMIVIYTYIHCVFTSKLRVS